MSTAVRDLIRAGDRVVGVRADGPDGPRDFLADLVVGTDGRFSTVRKRGGFTEIPSPQHFDVLNFLVPFPEFWPDRTTVRLELGPGCLTGGIPTADGQLWVGMTIQKGQSKDLRAGGPDAFTEELLRRTSPDLAAHLRANAGSSQTPGPAGRHRRRTWTVDGPWAVDARRRGASDASQRGTGDQYGVARRAGRRQPPLPGYSPAGTTRTAVDAAARRVVEERMPEIVAIQAYQRRMTRTFLGSDRFSSRLAMRILPFLARPESAPAARR